MRTSPGGLILLAMILIILGGVMRVHDQPAQVARAVNQEPDVPSKPGMCALYHTHTHGNGGRSYQLTCSAPVPDSVMVYPR